MVILSLALIQGGQLSISGDRMCTILINRLKDYVCPVKMRLASLDMTPVRWLGRKTSHKLLLTLYIYIYWKEKETQGRDFSFLF